MPTICITSADRVAISSLDRLPWACSASLNCAPIDLTGLSAFIALCMTTDMSRQRMADSCLSVRPTRLVPSNLTLPAAICAGGASNWATANSSVDFAARLAHDAEELAPVDRERDVIDRPDVMLGQHVVDGQAADLQDLMRFGHACSSARAAAPDCRSRRTRS